MQDERDEEPKMTQRDRDLAELFAQHTVSRLLEAAQNDEVIDRVADKWAGSLQRTVGRTVIRMVFYIAGVALLIGSIKAGLIDRLLEFFNTGARH